MKEVIDVIDDKCEDIVHISYKTLLKIVWNILKVQKCIKRWKTTVTSFYNYIYFLFFSDKRQT